MPIVSTSVTCRTVPALMVQCWRVPSILQGSTVLALSFYFPNSLVTSYNLTKMEQQQEDQHGRREEGMRELVRHFSSSLSTCTFLSGPVAASKGSLGRDWGLRWGINSSILSSSITTSMAASTMPQWHHAEPPVYLWQVALCLAVFPSDVIIPQIRGLTPMSEVGSSPGFQLALELLSINYQFAPTTYKMLSVTFVPRQKKKSTCLIPSLSPAQEFRRHDSILYLFITSSPNCHPFSSLPTLSPPLHTPTSTSPGYEDTLLTTIIFSSSPIILG